MARASEQPFVLRSPEDAVSLFAPRLRDLACEKLLVAHLDAESRLLALVEAGDGGASEVELPLRAIVADALRLESAGLILAHCHPSGDPEPSEADRVSTARLALVAGWLDIRLHDHLIFAGDDWRSFRAMGLL